MSSHSTGGRSRRPLLFSPRLAAARAPRRPRCPDIFMLGPGDSPTLADLLRALEQRPAEHLPERDSSETVP